MRTRIAAAAFIVIAMMIIFAPVVAASLVCVEDGGTDSCDLDCAACLCCSHGPQTILSAELGRSGGRQDNLAPELEAESPESFTRDILHVPRSSAVR